MKTEAIKPAIIRFEPGEPPRCGRFGDVYHPAAGAAVQARHVFLAGNGLPGRWQGREHFVILETGFGLGNNFLATWQAWREDPLRCGRLVFVSLEKHPPAREDLTRAPRATGVAALANALADAWPPLEPNIHLLEFEQGRVRLMLALGDARHLLRGLQLQADAFYLDGFAPARNPELWEPQLLQALARKAAPGATAATWSAARAVREGLQAGGFQVRVAAGTGGKRDMTVAAFAPAFVPRALPGREPVMCHVMGPTRVAAPRHALIIGAGLAGAAAADALSRQGWRCTVLERRPGAAQRASGNPGGILHGTAHAVDGVHARFTRAAALLAQRRYRSLLAEHQALGLHGDVDGLLRVSGAEEEQHRDSDTASDRDTENGNGPGIGAPPVAAHDLPPRATTSPWLPPPEASRATGTHDPRLAGRSTAYVQALAAQETCSFAGLGNLGAAWLYPGGGWMSPVWLTQRLLSGERIALQTDASVARLERHGPRWRALDAQGSPLVEGDAVVLCTGAEPLEAWPLPGLALQALRGQVTWFDSPTLPLRPVAGNGYALGLPDGRLVCGATVSGSTEITGPAASDPDRPGTAPNPAAHGALRDDTSALLEADHRFNLERLDALCGIRPPPGAALGGRVGWRATAADRLPVVGAMPRLGLDRGSPQRLDQCRLVPREPGLFVLTGLASRGLTWAPLAAEVLAAWMSGTPVPLEGDLLDAIDPARGLVRQVRQAQRGNGKGNPTASATP